MRCNRVKEERNILRTMKGRKSNWIGHTLRRNCLLKHVSEAKIERTGRRRRRRCKQLLDDFKEKRRYCKLKGEALDILGGELALEEARGLSQDKLRNE
jgi:hypothetical protein